MNRLLRRQLRRYGIDADAVPEDFQKLLIDINRHYETIDEGNSTFSTLKVVYNCLIFYLVVFHSLSNLPLSNPLLFGIHQRFWMHSNILMFIIIGVTIHVFISAVPRRSSKRLLGISVALLLLPFATYCQKHTYNYYLEDE